MRKIKADLDDKDFKGEEMEETQKRSFEKKAKKHSDR